MTVFLYAVIVLLAFILGSLRQIVKLLTKQEKERAKAEKEYKEVSEDVWRALSRPPFEAVDKYSLDDLPFDVEEKALNKR